MSNCFSEQHIQQKGAVPVSPLRDNFVVNKLMFVVAVCWSTTDKIEFYMAIIYNVMC